MPPLPYVLKMQYKVKDATTVSTVMLRFFCSKECGHGVNFNLPKILVNNVLINSSNKLKFCSKVLCIRQFVAPHLSQEVVFKVEKGECHQSKGVF